MRIRSTGNFRFLFIICVIFFSAYKKADEVVQIIGLIRSSSSYPEEGEVLKHLKLDTYQRDEDLYGEISGNGLRSSWILGKDLTNRYPFLVDNSKNLKNFKVISSKSNRCLMTTQGLMLGVFDSLPETRKVDVLDEFQQPPFNGERVDNSFDTPLPDGIYPVPFESYNKEFNNVLRPWDMYSCKSFDEFNKKNIEKEGSYIDDYNKLLDESPTFEIKTILGGFKKHVADYKEILRVNNYLSAMRNFDINFDFSDETFKKMLQISSIYESMVYLNQDAKNVILYRLNNNINNNVREMYNAVNQGNDDYLRYVFYVGHFPSLWAFMSQLNLASTECLENEYVENKDDDKCFTKPVNNSSIIIKIYKLNSKLGVRVYYNGIEVTDKLGECLMNDICILEIFMETYLKENIFANEDDYDIQCANYDVNLNKKLIALCVACLLFSIVMLVVFIKLLKKKLKKN